MGAEEKKKRHGGQGSILWENPKLKPQDDRVQGVQKKRRSIQRRLGPIKNERTSVGDRDNREKLDTMEQGQVYGENGSQTQHGLKGRALVKGRSEGEGQSVKGGRVDVRNVSVAQKKNLTD